MNLLSLVTSLGSHELSSVMQFMALFERFKESPDRPTFFEICGEQGFTWEEGEILWQATNLLIKRYANPIER